MNTTDQDAIMAMGCQCCICGKSIANAPALDADGAPVRLIIRALRNASASQELFAHGQCVAGVLDSTVPFDLEALTD